MNENVMGCACRTYGRREINKKRFWWGNLRIMEHLKNLSVSGKILLKRIVDWCGEALTG
jgi:hypothetical protein